jgi:hypothetical protein
MSFGIFGDTNPVSAGAGSIITLSTGFKIKKSSKGVWRKEVVPTDISSKANKDLSNVTALPASVKAQLKGDTGARGAQGPVGATFSFSGTTLTITT